MTFWEWLSITQVTGYVYVDIFDPYCVSIFAVDRNAPDVTHTGVYLRRLAGLTFAELRPWANYQVESASYLGTAKQWGANKYANEEDMVILEIRLKKPEERRAKND